MSRLLSQIQKRQGREKMPVERGRQSPLVKPLVVLALPGMYLLYKYREYKRGKAELQRQKVTEKELAQLNQKIDKLLLKIDDNDVEPHAAAVPDDECVVCLQSRATMQTYPCGHKVVCRKCFVKTIQVAVAQRCLPLRCVICREKVLKLRQTSARSSGASSMACTPTRPDKQAATLNLCSIPKSPSNKVSFCKRLPRIRPLQALTPQIGLMEAKPGTK
ncbi:uncharacterized protein LOC135477960 [Liolophura sinensis]|uniref:uncharacterized protein LOC135477960 n=1 Tax=Liolophura sinensis TaxID=3198878 RepID=UPI0031582A65